MGPFWTPFGTWCVRVSGPSVQTRSMALRQSTTGSTTISASEALLDKKFPSIVEIKNRLPKHCFEAPLPTSVYFAVKDLVLVVLLYLTAVAVWHLLPATVGMAFTPVYWFLQGTLFMAIFVVGHDCGHGSFSRHETINDVIGTVLHSCVMCPYFSWKLSHRVHHKNTGNIDKDEIFFPMRESRDTGTSFLPGFGLGVGWFVYLVCGYKYRKTQHFNPFDPLYVRHMVGVSLSLAWLGAWTCLMYYCCLKVGFVHVGYYYAVPVFVFASILVVVTFLHHTGEDVPWYADGEWDNVRGQVSSIDRDYGWAHELIHNIGTHQIHHLFPKIPHYHLEEATRHFREAFPDIIHIQNDPIIPSFIRMFVKFCKQNVIQDSAKVHVYK